MSNLVLVKEEPEWQNCASSGVSEAAAVAGLYADHAVKDELVLGPELLQPPDVAYALPEVSAQDKLGLGGCISSNLSQYTAHSERSFTSRVKVEREETDTESKICNKDTTFYGILRKGQLLSECKQDSSWAVELHGRQPTLRDCSVRLERIFELEVLSDSPTATHHYNTGPHPVHINKYICDTCGRTFSNKHYMIRHIQEYSKKTCDHRQTERLTCKLCDEPGSQHMGTEPCPRDVSKKQKDVKQHSCDICRKKFSRLRDLERHEHIHTGYDKSAFKDDLIRTEDKAYSCKVCNKLFQTANTLKSHKLTHTGERPYSCGICEMKFTRLAHRDRHIIVHTREKLYTCEICGKVFSQSDGYKRHKLIHSGEKPYSCDICEKRFNYSTSLKEHLNIHLDQKPYSCEVCQKKFAHLKTFKMHKLCHSDTKPFSCEVCAKKFSRLDSFRRHKLTHTGARPHSCRMCSKRFSRLYLAKQCCQDP